MAEEKELEVEVEERERESSYSLSFFLRPITMYERRRILSADPRFLHFIERKREEG